MQMSLPCPNANKTPGGIFLNKDLASTWPVLTQLYLILTVKTPIHGRENRSAPGAPNEEYHVGHGPTVCAPHAKANPQ